MPKNWNIWRYDTFSCDILDLHAIPMLKYRPVKKIDWASQPAKAECKNASPRDLYDDPKKLR